MKKFPVFLKSLSQMTIQSKYDIIQKKVKITKVTYKSKRKKVIDSYSGYSFHCIEGAAVAVVVAEPINCSYYLDEVTFVIELI